jgi:uncharacterized membrane protein YfcA
MIDPLYVVSGFGVGLLVGMTGVGGGSLMTPLLILLFGIHPATAVGTDLLYAAATKTGGSVAHGWARSIHWLAVIRLASGSIPASILTLVVLWQLDLNGESSGSLVNLVLCFALFLTATSLVFRKAIMERYRWRLQQLDPRTTARATVLVGAALGVLVSIDFFGRGRRGGCDGASAALPAAADGAHRRLRHRARGTVNAGCRVGTLGDGRNRLAPFGRAAGGFLARHCNW